MPSTTWQYNPTWHQAAWGLLGQKPGVPFAPNATQAPAVQEFLAGCRLLLLCGGERSGKSILASAIAILTMGPDAKAPKGKAHRPRRYWIIGPDYRQSRPEFLYIHDALARGGFVAKSSMPQSETSPWSLETSWGVILETRSAGEVMKLASFTVDGVIIAEAAQQTEETLRKSLGRVAETRGWIILVGTLEDGLPWYEEYLRRWSAPNPEDGKSFSIPTWSNVDIFPLGRNDPEMLRLMHALPADYVAHRFGAQAIRRSNLVVPEFDYRSHVKQLALNPDLPVELAVDPGKNAYAVVLLQHEGAYTHVLDCVYTRGMIAQAVIPLVMQHPAWPYVDTDAPATHVMDIAGFGEPGTESQASLWREITGIQFVGKLQKERDTIAVLRYRLNIDPILGVPLVDFADTMRTGVAPDGTSLTMLSEFDLWRWPKRTLGGNEPEKPIDSNNHALKALGYKLLYKYGNQRLERKRSTAGVKRASWRVHGNFAQTFGRRVR